MTDLFSLKDKTAIVTGASGLLGKAHCEALAAAGANVVLADIRPVSFEMAGNHLRVILDVSDEGSVQQAKERILNRFGSIDILVNNAAINDMFESPALAGKQSMFENYPLQLWDNAWKVNVTGVFLCSQVFGAVMAEQCSGSIINIASTYGMVGPDQNIYKSPSGEQVFFKSPAYPVTKSAVIGFTKFLAAYWGHKNVRVNTLSPGGVENKQDDFFIKNYTAKTLLGRMASPADYQGALVFLASDASAYMTGANLVVDGGWTAI